MTKTVTIIFIVCGIVILGGLSCTRRIYVPQETVIERTDTVRQERLRIDSVVIRDSIITLIKGDTVKIDHWHTSYRERVRVDTVVKVQTQTVYQTRTEIKEINRLTWWQQLLMWTGVLSIFIFIIIGIYKSKRI